MALPWVGPAAVGILQVGETVQLEQKAPGTMFKGEYTSDGAVTTTTIKAVVTPAQLRDVRRLKLNLRAEHLIKVVTEVQVNVAESNNSESDVIIRDGVRYRVRAVEYSPSAKFWRCFASKETS